MNKLIFIIAMASTVYFGYSYYADYQQKLKTEKAQELAAMQLQQEQIKIELAVRNKDITALNQFIRHYPQSTLLKKAIFERNLLTYQQTINSGNPTIIKQYIASHPDSQYKVEAQQKLNNIMLDLADKEFTQKQIQSRQRYVEEQKIKKQASVSTQKERVNRALSIYQKLRQKEELKTYQNKMEQKREQEYSSKCNQIKDQLRQFKRYSRWYNLDENGNRVFMDNQQVATMKTDMQKTYNDNCL